MAGGRLRRGQRDARRRCAPSSCPAAPPPPRSCTSAAPSAAAPSAARCSSRTPTPRSCATSTGSRTCCSSSAAAPTTATSRCGSPGARRADGRRADPRAARDDPAAGRARDPDPAEHDGGPDRARSSRPAATPPRSRPGCAASRAGRSAYRRCSRRPTRRSSICMFFIVPERELEGARAPGVSLSDVGPHRVRPDEGHEPGRARSTRRSSDSSSRAPAPSRARFGSTACCCGSSPSSS